MKVYNYDDFTKEFLYSENAFKDPMDNALYLIPRNATLLSPPLFDENEIPVFNDTDWEIKPDFRGNKQICQKNLEISEIRNIGDLDNGFFLISDIEITEMQNGKIASFENGIFSVKNPPDEQIISIKRQQVNALRELAFKSEGASFKGDLFDIDQASLTNILAKKSLAEKEPDATFNYRSKTNQTHELTGDEISELAFAITTKIDDIYEHSWQIKSDLTVNSEVVW